MQSNRARLLVGAAAVAAIAVLAIVFSSGGEEDGGDAAPVAETTNPERGDGGGEKRKKPSSADVETIVVRRGEPVGGVRELEYEKGEEVMLEVRSDVDEHVHVHGYDLVEDVAAGGRARFEFRAEIDGVFDVELEDSGVELARLTVAP